MRPCCLLAVAFGLSLSALLPGKAAAADFVRDEVIVKYRPGIGNLARGHLQSGAGTSNGAKLPGGARRLKIGDGKSVAATIAELERSSLVEYAVPNHLARASTFFPNDRGFGAVGEWPSAQWNFFGPAGVNAPEAWDLARAAGAPGGAGVRVAVLDTGVAYSSRDGFRRAPDLYPNRFVPGYDFVDEDPHPNDEFGSDRRQQYGHGTHVTGTIAQRTNNGHGVTGLAYGARIMPLRVLNADGLGDAAAIARAIRFAADRDVRVINMSFEFDSSVSRREIPDVLSAIRYAHHRGVVMVAAAGNHFEARAATVPVAYPARTHYVISVGATTERLCQSEYTNGGSALDLVAPGGGSDAPWADNPRDAANCKPGAPGRYIYQQTFTSSVRNFGLPGGFEGTSMACPHVSGAAALLIASGRLGPSPTPLAVERRLKATARDLGPIGRDARYGAGLLDAAAALRP